MVEITIIKMIKNERAQKLLQRVQNLKSQDVSHDEEYGASLGFGVFETIKQRSCAELSNLFSRLAEVESMMPAASLEKELKQVDEAVALLEKQSQDVKNILAHGVHHSDFPRQRALFIEKIQNTPLLIAERTIGLELYVEVLSLRKSFEGLSIDKTTNDLNTKVAEFHSITEEARKLLDALKDRTARKAMEEKQESFEALAGEHARSELGWFWCLVGSAIALILVVGWVVFTDTAPHDPWSLVSVIVKRLLAFAIAAAFLRISLSKFNSERNLVITFKNRGTALKQFLLFEASLADDRDAKNLLRLEIARYLFSDPKTGLTESGTSGDVNISPVVQMLDRLGAAKGS